MKSYLVNWKHQTINEVDDDDWLNLYAEMDYVSGASLLSSDRIIESRACKSAFWLITGWNFHEQKEPFHPIEFYQQKWNWRDRSANLHGRIA